MEVHTVHDRSISTAGLRGHEQSVLLVDHFRLGLDLQSLAVPVNVAGSVARYETAADNAGALAAWKILFGAARLH